ncbi:MAG: A/G-specific adenine glycosylase [bacterium]
MTGKRRNRVRDTVGLPNGWDVTGFRRALARWFGRHGRALPWREAYGSYPIWISEIMLQQTQVETVLPYFQRWMERFPDVPAVAAADQEAVLKAWEGLGYYSRARNLHRAAREMVARHGGELPGDLSSLLSLPGIGRYTAGAIVSIGFNRPAPIVDGNIGRVLARIFAVEHPPRVSEGQRLLWAWAGELVPLRNPRVFNQGLMELGALVCRPRSPACGDCPVARFCAARAAGRVALYPLTTPRKERPLREGVMALVRDAQSNLLLRRRASEGLWGGLWEPPWLEPENGESTGNALKRLLRELGLKSAADPAPLGVVEHGLTHFRLKLTCFAIAVTVDNAASAHSPSAPSTTLRWAAASEIAAYPLARLSHKALALEGGGG